MTGVVVGAALIDRERVAGARVLAACRAHPPEFAGLWEFPGGKVEPGEDDPSALVRECREELAVEIEVAEPLGEVLLPSGRPLRVYFARVTGGEPTALEHAELRWLAAGELDDVPWIPADRPLVDVLRRHLAP